MKSVAALAFFAVPALMFGACSQGDVNTPGTGGSSSTPGGGSSTTAGDTSTTPTSGTPATSAGSSTGGQPGSSGSSQGTSGSGMTMAGSSASGSGPMGGSSAGGMSGGSSSGGTSAGGMSGGSTAAGAAGTAAGGGGNLVMDVTGMANASGDSFASSFFIVPCYGQQQQDCLTTMGGTCPSTNGVPFETQGFTQTQTFKLGGTSGSMYQMTFTLNGITEGKYYEKGTRDAGNGAVANADGDAGTDTFYRGGNPVAQEHYNIYKMTIKKPDGSELEHYYLNSFPGGNVGRYENHNTFALHYQKTIPVVGGGSIELFLGDSNCHAVDNCGPGEYNGTCTKSRNIPSEPNLMLPTKYMGKDVASLNTISGAKQPYHAQLIHITVNSVTAM